MILVQAEIDADDAISQVDDKYLLEEVVSRKLNLPPAKPCDVTGNELVADLMRAFETQDRSEFSYLLDKVYNLAEGM